MRSRKPKPSKKPIKSKTTPRKVRQNKIIEMLVRFKVKREDTTLLFSKKPLPQKDSFMLFERLTPFQREVISAIYHRISATKSLVDVRIEYPVIEEMQQLEEVRKKYPETYAKHKKLHGL